MYALGGTALTICRLSLYFRYRYQYHSHQEYRYTCKIFGDIGFKKIGTIRWLTQEGLAF